jgi:hypothetical protein
MGIGRSILAVLVTAAIVGLFVLGPRDSSHSRDRGQTAVTELRLFV